MSRCIAGRFPPPLGGVSVYVSRRYAALKLVDNATECLDFSDNFIRKLMRVKSTSIEVNSLNIFIVLLFFCSGKIGLCTFIDHNASRHYGGIKKWLLLWLLSFSKDIWIVNSRLREFYPSSFKVEIISPFLAPDESEEDVILESYPAHVVEFLKNEKFVVNSAWKYIPYEDTDLYGIGTSLRLLDEIPSLKLLLVIGVYESDAFSVAQRASIAKHKNSGRLCILSGQKQLWPVFKKKPICLRLTPTDGDSVSVRESLYFDCVTVVSDVIARPEGSVTYEYGSFDNLKSVLTEYL
jgi:hypothetical protein